MKYAIDAGHGTKPDTGAMGIGNEEKMNLEVANLLTTKLKAAGHTVVSVRPASATSVSNSLQQRVNTANANKVDLYVSIHFNAFNGKAKGSEVFAISATGKKYATAVQHQLVKLGYFNRGVKDGSKLFVVKNTTAPSILVEGCFIDNKEDMARYSAAKIADAIFAGITIK